MDSVINSTKGKTHPASTAIFKNQLGTLYEEIQTLGDQTDRLPFIMSLMRDAESKLKSLCDRQENNARFTHKRIGAYMLRNSEEAYLNNPVNIAMMQHYRRQLPPLALRPLPVSHIRPCAARAPELSRDLVEEILSRLPPISLILTKEFTICPLSVTLHGIFPSVEVKRMLSLPDPHSNYSNEFKICKVFHCDGLLLCTNEDESRLVVWNPITRQTRWIEAGKRFIKDRAFALGYCQDKSYKILSYCYSSGKELVIYDFSSGSWRILDHDIAPCWSTGYSSQWVSLKGKIYWFAKYKMQTQRGVFLHRFDFSTEKSSLLGRLPYPCSRFENLNLSVVREEKLSVLLQRDSRSKTEIWVTNKIDETNEVLWSRVLVLDLKNCDIRIPFGASFLLDEEKKIIVCTSKWTDLDDKTETKTMNIIYVLGEKNQVTLADSGVDTGNVCWPAIISYVPSLAQINRAGGKRKRA